jgi:putative redox protein
MGLRYRQIKTQKTAVTIQPPPPPIFALRFCESRKFDTEKLKIRLEFQSNEKTHMVEKIVFKINLPPEFPEKYNPALIKSMNLCYVKKHLEQPPEFEFEIG